MSSGSIGNAASILDEKQDKESLVSFLRLLIQTERVQFYFATRQEADLANFD